jgi:hypothetical protein
MFLKKTILLFSFILVVNFIGSAQNKALSKIDIKDLKEHLTFISSDKLQGRKLGTEVDGLGITADYLAENAKRIGLKPAVENYFQPVEMVFEKPLKDRFVEVTNKKGKVGLKSDKLVCLEKSTGKTEIQTDAVVLLGFATEDLLTADIKGKIVVVSQSTPELFLEKEIGWSSQLERPKIAKVAAKNPKAILVVLNPNKKATDTFNRINRWINRERYALKSSGEKEAPVLIVMPEVADALLGGNGKYKKYLTSVAKGKKSEPVLIKNRKVKLKFGLTSEPVKAKNVVAYIEGSDPVLKDEYFVYMAHYDHLGVDKTGDVYNGADDNGSGTVTLMEVAEAFASLDKKPKRSIVFLWVTCEELGMLGSLYYSNHPVFPMEKTVACINIDMDGRVFEPRDTVWNKSPKKVKDFDGLYTLANNVWPELAKISDEKCAELSLVPDKSLPKRFLRSSDHYSFHKNGVPVLNYATGYHADYHKVGDEVSKINFEKIKRVANLSFLVGYEIANLDKIEFEREEKQH